VSGPSNSPAPAPVSAPASNQQSATLATQASFPPESIDQLVALGFSREEAVNALAACGGNVEYAAGLLFQG